jgi:hypothetical protein
MCKFWTKKRDGQEESENPKSLIISSSSPFALPNQVFSIYLLPVMILYRLPPLRDILSPIPFSLANSDPLLLYISDVTGENHILPQSRKNFNFLKKKSLRKNNFGLRLSNLSDLLLIIIDFKCMPKSPLSEKWEHEIT